MIVIGLSLKHVQTLDKGISRVKSIFSSSCSSILRKDVIQFIRVLNSRRYSFRSSMWVPWTIQDTKQLPTLGPKRPPNFTDVEFSAPQWLRAWDDIVIKPADKRGALMVWRADLYRSVGHRKLGDTTFYMQQSWQGFDFHSSNHHF
jgi:hypothetical protein